MLVHKGTADIETERLLLRRFKMDDARDIFDNYANDSEVAKYLSWYPHKNIKITKQILKSWVDNYQNKDFYF